MTHPGARRLGTSNAGKHQALTMATAVHKAGVALDSLTLFYVSYKIFDASSSVLRALVRPLCRLRLLMDSTEEVDSRGVQVTGGADIAFRIDNLRKLLAEARNLRVLALLLPKGYLLARGGLSGAHIQNAVGDVTYQHLYELRIVDSEIDAEVLLVLILHHKATLRRLILSDLNFPNGPTTWRSVLTRINGQLPNQWSATQSSRLQTCR